jgi:hypothetical protein
VKFTIRFHDHIITSVESICRQLGFPKTVIEIGVFEGETTFKMSEVLSRKVEGYKHYAIDPFDISADLPEENISSTKEIFLNNLKESQSGLIEFMNMKSFDALIDLRNRGVKADLIYVDGDHRAPEVLQDAVLGFELLNIGGVMLFDDSVVWRYKGDITNSPKIAVDNFIQCYWDRLEVLEIPNGYQLAIRRKK